MKKHFLYETLCIIAGATIFALSVVWFADPAGLVTGGVTGLSIVVKTLSQQFLGFEIPLFLTNLIINIPLFIISYIQSGIKFIYKSLIGMLWLTVALWFCEFLPNPLYVGEDLLLTALLSGIFAGVAIGLVLKVNATTGGSDMLASIIKKKMPHANITAMIFVIDAVIILLGLFVFGPVKTVYAAIAVFVASVIANTVIEGLHFSKTVFIISDKSEKIAKTVMSEMGRGVTAIDATGMYTGEDKKLLFVVVSAKEVHKLKILVKEIDKTAFVAISETKEVLGEGFEI
ncbi:MAG: YitT family protein [Clostridia bacterium]|nr:YitT family protein [Clostridia bacterium]MBR3577130.1 YitT family protein [Clostridia bacterium]